MTNSAAIDFTHDQWVEKASSLNLDAANFIDGKLVPAVSGKTFDDINPANGQVLAKLPRSGEEDVDRAVAAARRAFKSGSWSRLEPRNRMQVLYRFADLIERETEHFSLLDTLDMGKPILDMVQVDVPGSVRTLRFFAETIDKLEGYVTNTRSDALHYVLRQPLGVVGCVVPWNFPLMMAMWKVAPALACGNSVVLKPAEQSPLSAVLLAQLFVEAGGPEGVFNVIQGLGEEAGKALARHMDVDKIGFTGSVEVGKLMLVYAGQSNMKRVATECGGKTPQIVLADTPDLDAVARAAIDGIYFNQGEVCNASSRLLIEESIHDRFVERFKALALDSYVPGDPLKPKTRMGPMVTFEHRDRVRQYLELGEREGAKVAFRQGMPAGLDQGAYIEPVLFTQVDNSMRIAQEEIFGPVTAAIPVKNAEHAIEVANKSHYGLAASIWTQDIDKALGFARDIEAGVVWVNCFDAGDSTTPWGGYKQSGTGRDKCFATLYDYTQTKSVWIPIRS